MSKKGSTTPVSRSSSGRTIRDGLGAGTGVRGQRWFIRRDLELLTSRRRGVAGALRVGRNLLRNGATIAPMHAAALCFDFMCRSRSLKAKRAAIRPILDTLPTFPGFGAEVDHQDQWQRAAIAVAAVSGTHSNCAKCSIRWNALWRRGWRRALDVETAWLETTP